MFCVDRYSRPSAEDLGKELSLFSTTDLSLAWNHAKNVTRTEWEELIVAHEKGSAEGAKALLAESVEPRNLGTIHFAEVRGEGSIVEVLLDAGVPVDIRNAVGQDALHCASRNGHHAIVKKLLENGADINVKDANSQIALHGAAVHGYEAIIVTLLDSGADVFAEDLDSSATAHFAVRRQHSRVRNLLESRENAVLERDN